MEALYTKIIKLEIPSSIQTNGKFTTAINSIESKIDISSKIFSILEMAKNSTIKRNINPEKPAKSPSAFQDPIKLSVFSVKTPKDKSSGINKRAL